MRKLLSAAGGAAFLVAALAPSALAGAPERFSYTDHFVVEHACGINETVDVAATVRGYFAADGTWLRDVVQYRYDSWFQGPGGAFPLRATQTAIFTPTTGTLSGQGIFIRGHGLSIVYQDVGRFVFDRSDGSTIFATPKVLQFDDAEGFEAMEAALCEAIG
jgi:hypothetical protein